MGRVAWRTLTSVRFAVVQIILLAVAGLIGTLVPQLPAFALHNPAAYAEEMAGLQRQFESLAVLGFHAGPVVVDVFERLGFFRIFSAPWFILLLTLLVVSIIVCTLDRTPRLWRSVHHIKPVQPAAFYDLRLDERARFTGLDEAALGDVTAALRQRRFKVRREDALEDGAGSTAVHLYGDRNRYFKMATLFTHLGLILFLAGGAVTVAFGFETVLFVGEGQTAPVRPVGTPDNMLVKNISFEAPTRPDGSFIDFRTDLAVYQNGQLLERKTIRVNDPLEIDGWVFHQNTFGPAAVLEIRDSLGSLVWDGPVLLAGELADRPQGFITVPGSELGLLLVLDRTTDGVPVLAVTGLTPGADAEEAEVAFVRGLGLGGTSDPTQTGGFSINWRQASSFTGMVVKRDPGQVLIWIAYLSLITGLVLTFYFPRRRVWARLDGDRLSVALTADRYVNAEREFEQLLDGLAVRLGRRPERGRAPSVGASRS
ncbi:MAG TPA: cytochrome c biogenesis protein ResB [Candidatus Limnocylindrales bacterium]|nr:cytochrome c biogenesis protein ResB [Candidatus Limnocylindrales bacterium]